MTAAPETTRPLSTAALDRRMAAAWARLLIGVLAAAVPVAVVLASTDASRAAGTAAVRTAMTSVSAALRAEHDVDGAWPADLVGVGGSVLDDAGHRIATIPDGMAVAYQRSVDGSRAVLTLSDRGASAVFDSARNGR